MQSPLIHAEFTQSSVSQLSPI